MTKCEGIDSLLKSVCSNKHPSVDSIKNKNKKEDCNKVSNKN